MPPKTSQLLLEDPPKEITTVLESSKIMLDRFNTLIFRSTLELAKIEILRD